MTRQTKLTLEKKNSPAASAGIRTRNLSITSPALLPTNYPGVVHRSKAENISSCGTGQQDKAREREREREREKERGRERKRERKREREKEKEKERLGLLTL